MAIKTPPENLTEFSKLPPNTYVLTNAIGTPNNIFCESSRDLKWFKLFLTVSTKEYIYLSPKGFGNLSNGHEMEKLLCGFLLYLETG